MYKFLHIQQLDNNLNHRARIATLYKDSLLKIGTDVPEVPSNAEPAFVRYPLLVKDRNAVIKRIARHVVPGTWFTSVLEEAVSPVYGGYQSGSCPNAELATRHLINLPTHPRVSMQDAGRFMEIFAELKSSHSGIWRPIS